MWRALLICLTVAATWIVVPASDAHAATTETVVKGVHHGGNGLRFISYERTYRGLPVIGGDSVVMVDRHGQVVTTARAQGHADIDVDVTPTLPQSAVVSSVPPRLVVLARLDKPKLAWETVSDGKHMYLDAHNGAVLESTPDRSHGGLGHYYGLVPLATTRTGPTTYSMTDPTRTGLKCGGQNGAAYAGPDDFWGNGSGTNLETACVDALYAAQRTWDMLGQWLGRNGFDGAGRGFPIRVGAGFIGGAWDNINRYVDLGRSKDGTRQYSSLDIVAHEFGHSIFQATPGGVGTSRENGGLNEGTGDIFAALTEHFTNHALDPPDYTIAEEVNASPSLYMYWPARGGHRDCWSASIGDAEVHAAGGPLDHWFYLLAEGTHPTNGNPVSPTCNYTRFNGIGIRTAGQIFYNALLMKTSTWRYTDVRTATLWTARNLFPNRCTEFEAVKAAWDAVTVPPQLGDPTCHVDDFQLWTSPGSATVQAGGTVFTTVFTSPIQQAQELGLSTSALPAGVMATLNPASTIPGNPVTLTVTTAPWTASGTFPIIVRATNGSRTKTTNFMLVVTGGGPGCSARGQKLGNPGFETGTAPWLSTDDVIGDWLNHQPRTGTRYAWLNGWGTVNADLLAQPVTLPAACSSYTLMFWLKIGTAEPTLTMMKDTMRLQVRAANGLVILSTLATYSNLTPISGYSLQAFDLGAWAGQSIHINFTAIEDESLATEYVVDDVTLTVT